MNVFSFHRKAMSRLLILIYLLIGSGLGNALLWCQESEAYSHLEYNVSGNCLSACLPEEKGHEGVGQQERLTAFSDADDCLDTEIPLTHYRSSGTNAPSPNPVETGCLIPRVFSFSIVSAASHAKLNLIAQPPPRQTLAALRTTVLLI